MTEFLGEERNGTMVVAGFWRGRTERSGDFNTKFLAEVEARGIHRLGAHHTDAWACDGVCLLKQLMEAAAQPAIGAAGRRAGRAGPADGGRALLGGVDDDVCLQGHDAELPDCVIEITGGEWTKFAEAPADGCA